MAKNIVLKGIASGSRDMLVQALDMVAGGNVEIPTDRSFHFDDAAEAYRYLSRGEHLGKVLVRHTTE